MAEHGKVEYATATGNDYAEHEATYLNIVKLAKVGTVGLAGVVVGLGIHGTTDAMWTAILGIFVALIAMGRGLMKDTVVPSAVVLVLLLILWALVA